MRSNKFIYGMMAAALIAASCTDFDDYNEAYQTGGAGSNKTLWENISERENLSDFARLLSKGGYDKELSKSRFYTVWAPENGTFNFDEFNQMDSATLVQRFIKSNVADYNFVLSSSVDERVHVLNEKSFTLQNLEGCTFGGNDIVTSNIPSLNGTLHITDGAVQYMPNIYEYIFDNADTDSSIAQYLKKYEDVYLDEKNSVVGPIDSLGQQTYSDSVMVMRNVIMEQMRAKLDNEDSLYTMIVPTDDAYTKAYDKIKSYFNYADVTTYYNINSSAGTRQTKSVENGDYDAAYLSDSLARWCMAASLVLSHTNSYNFWLDEVGRADEHNPLLRDTLVTTTGVYLSNGEQIMARTIGDPEQVSNGYVRRVDSLALFPWDVWCSEIYPNIFSTTMRPYSQNTSGINTMTVAPNNFNPAVGDYISSYIDVIPRGNNNPKVHFYLPNICSTRYNIYIVFVPECITGSVTTEPQLLKFNVGVNYTESADGDIGTLSNPSVEFEDLVTDSAHLNKIDTFFVGEVNFPYAYVNIDENGECMPSLYVEVSRTYSERPKYTNRMRIARLILRPVEYDEYLKKEDEAL